MGKEESIKYIVDKFKLDMSGEMPIRIPDTDRYETLTSLYKELGYKEGAEIGVAEGNFSKHICDANPGVRLHCIDCWEAHKGYNDFDEGFFSEAEKTARGLLKPFNCNIIKKYSEDAVEDFKDGSLDFVYIDGDHSLLPVIHDLTKWSKKVRPGGMISGHDWSESKRHWYRMHVMYALEAYTKSWRISPYFVLGRDERIKGEKRQSARSWFYFV